LAAIASLLGVWLASFVAFLVAWWTSRRKQRAQRFSFWHDFRHNPLVPQFSNNLSPLAVSTAAFKILLIGFSFSIRSSPTQMDSLMNSQPTMTVTEMNTSETKISTPSRSTASSANVTKR
jgi:hypothetical protein